MDKFIIVFEKCEEGGYHAYMRENPGVQTQGRRFKRRWEISLTLLRCFSATNCRVLLTRG